MSYIAFNIIDIFNSYGINEIYSCSLAHLIMVDLGCILRIDRLSVITNIIVTIVILQSHCYHYQHWDSSITDRLFMSISKINLLRKDLHWVNACRQKICRRHAKSMHNIPEPCIHEVQIKFRTKPITIRSQYSCIVKVQPYPIPGIHTKQRTGTFPVTVHSFTLPSATVCMKISRIQFSDSHCLYIYLFILFGRVFVQLSFLLKCVRDKMTINLSIYM